MTTLAAGVFKQLAVKKQTAQGTKAPAGAAGTAKLLRRVTSTLDLNKATYKSAEIRPSLQRADFRHGIRSVSGSINGELSVGTYQDFMASVLRAAFSAAVTSGAQVNITAAVTSSPNGTFTRAAGSFLTDGFRIGMVVRCSGWTAPATANNAHNFLITNLSATVMTVMPLDGVAIVAKAAGDSVTILETGKHCAIPSSNHTRDYWTIEHNFADITQSEQFIDCVISGMNVKLPATGMATVEFPVMGIDMQTSTAAYFTSPAAASTGKNLAAVNGVLLVNGVAVGYLTGLEFNVNGNYSMPGGTVGGNTEPDVLPGAFDVTGTVTVMFADATMRDYFVNETEVALVAVLTADNTATSDFQSHVFPRVKLGGGNKDDGEKGITQTMPFTALENTSTTNHLSTTYWVQDSAAT